LSAMHAFKSLTQEAPQVREFTKLNKEFQARSIELAKMRGIVSPVMQGMNGLTVLIVIWYGGIRVVHGDLLVADIVAFIAYLNVLAWPTAAFGWMLSLLERGRAAVKRLDEILESKPEIADPPSPVSLPVLREGVQFRDVSFAYSSQIDVCANLEDVSF